MRCRTNRFEIRAKPIIRHANALTSSTGGVQSTESLSTIDSLQHILGGAHAPIRTRSFMKNVVARESWCHHFRHKRGRRLRTKWVMDWMMLPTQANRFQRQLPTYQVSAGGQPRDSVQLG